MKFPRFLYSTIILILIGTICKSCSPKSSTDLDNSDSVVLDNKPMSKLKFKSGIRAIFHDSKGNYWIGSHQEGVAMFDGTSFTYFSKEDGLSDNQVRTIQEDKNGIIWFGTGNGISNFDGSEMNQIKADESSSKEAKWKLDEDYLWFNAGEEPGVYQFDGEKLNYLAFTVPDSESYRSFSYATTGFSKNNREKLWISTYSAVFGFNGNSFTVIHDKSPNMAKQKGDLHARCVQEDSDGNVWIGNNGIGVLLYSGDTIVNFSEQQGLIHSNSSWNGDFSPEGTLEHVFSIEEDNAGNIWFGDRDTGAWKYDGKSITNYIIDDKLMSQLVWDIYLDKNGNILFATKDGGVYKFKNESFERIF